MILDFDKWFQQRGSNHPLVGPERAILKTFCWYLTHESDRVTTQGVEFKVLQKMVAMEKAAPDEGGPAQGLRVGGKF